MYRTIVVAGTFDGLHKGHERVLARAFEEGKKIIIGLTSDKYISRYKIFNFQFSIFNTYDQRKQKLEQWLGRKGFMDRTTIVSLDDPYGPSLTENFDALIVTADNKKTGEEINQKRQTAGLTSIALIEVPLVPAEDLVSISSTRIRKKEIDREGHLIMPDSLRPQLQQPLGKILTGDEIAQSITKNRNKTIITVGDITTKTLLDAGVTPTLAIIDNHVERKPYTGLETYLNTTALRSTVVKSGPGYISKEALAEIKQWSEKINNPSSRPQSRDPEKETRNDSVILIVDGEEDLLALPAVVYAPEGSMVYYGQPRLDRGQPSIDGSKKGMVEVFVTNKAKVQAQLLLDQFLKQ